MCEDKQKLILFVFFAKNMKNYNCSKCFFFNWLFISISTNIIEYCSINKRHNCLTNVVLCNYEDKKGQKQKFLTGIPSRYMVGAGPLLSSHPLKPTWRQSADTYGLDQRTRSSELWGSHLVWNIQLLKGHHQS